MKDELIEYKGKKYDVIDENDAGSVYGCRIFEFDKRLYLKEHKESILDEVEKEYLKNVIKYVIKPTHNKVEFIIKHNYNNKDYFIEIKINYMESIQLPYFKDNRMYKGMKINEPYALEELGLE